MSDNAYDRGMQRAIKIAAVGSMMLGLLFLALVAAEVVL